MDTFTVIIVAFLAVCIAVGVITHLLNEKRRQMLLEKYGDATIVARLMNREIWQGMSEEQLIDSWGPPVTRDQKVYKTKTTETFKYNQTGKNRYGSRVKVENQIVVGWNQNNS